MNCQEKFDGIIQANNAAIIAIIEARIRNKAIVGQVRGHILKNNSITEQLDSALKSSYKAIDEQDHKIVGLENEVEALRALIARMIIERIEINTEHKDKIELIFKGRPEYPET